MKFLAFLLAFVALSFAAPRPTAEDLQICYEKNKVSQFDYHGHVAVALTANLAAVIADDNKTLAPVDYIKHDPYLGLYLVKIPTTMIAPFMMNEKDLKIDTWVNVLDANVTAMGHVKALSANLGEFDELSFEAPKTGILLCDCCQMVGIAKGADKFIGSRYLRHFIKHEDVYYGDIGTVFDSVNGKLLIKSVYPFGPASDKLQAGDIVKAVNDMIPRDLRELNESVLFAEKGEILRFEVERNGKKQIINVSLPGDNKQFFDSNATMINLADINFDSNVTKPEVNATKIPLPEKKEVKKPVVKDNLYTGYGFSVGKDMRITRIKADSPAAKAGLERGDLIMQVGKEPIKNAQILERKLSNGRLNHLLVERKDFQFFVRIRK